MADSESQALERLEGVVVSAGPHFGFISAENLGDEIYFKSEWFVGSPPLKEKESVTFVLKRFGDRLQAHYPRRVGQEKDLPSSEAGPPLTTNPFDWAYFGYLPSVLAELSTLALKERWEFMNTSPDPERPFPILYSYLFHTFGKLVLEKKVLLSEDGSLAAFNTGLVDSRYETIYALFRPNHEGRTPWRLVSFCIAGEGPGGQNLVRHFNPLPKGAHYFDEPSDLFYDTRAGKPELSWKHCVIDRLERYPWQFLKDHWPSGFPPDDVRSYLTRDERKQYFRELGEAVEADRRVYRMIMNRVKDAVNLAIKRAAWNFKTAVPTYYPRVRRLQLLLPICLVSDEQPDMALAVESTKVGSYLGHTVLPLAWAYRNARLICRPDSDWLEPKAIASDDSDDDEDDE